MLEIRELLLRIPGITREEARGISELIAKRISERLPAGVGSRFINSLDLQITVSPGISRTALTERISSSIVREIQRQESK